MSLRSGSRLGAYEILAPIGAGGMGEVYRAKDLTLDREVAIKILPDVFAHDSERVARFTREAKTLASLNHPNIAQIYGILEEAGVGTVFAPGEAGLAKSVPTPPSTPPSHVHALVMELVEGEDLSVIIARGAMPLEDVLPLAKQIADALEAAHEQGIIHRDLKPANIKVRPDGTVKVLDFGLAKAMDPAGASGAGSAAHSPTMTARATQMGMILGTAAYMAPEQARGKAVDKRADIWAFGVVLYEMLAGRRLFPGEEVSDTLAAVLRQDVDWPALPPATPPVVMALLRRCLERDSKQRLRDIGEARVTLSQPAGAEVAVAPAAPPSGGGVRAFLRAGAIAVIAFAAGFTTASVVNRTAAVGPAATMLSFVPVTASGNVISASISPDGRYLVYVESDQGLQSLWLQQLAGGQTLRLIPDRGVAYWSHTFTPDGNNIVYGVKSDAEPRAALYTISTLGGEPRRLIGDIDSAPSFSPDGRRMTFVRQFAPSPGQSSLVISDADGSNEKVIATVKLPEFMAGIFFGGPAWSPDGRTIVTAVGRRGSPGGDARARLVQVVVDTGNVTTLADPGWLQAAQSLFLPDGKSLLVIARAPDQSLTQIWSVSMPQGETRRVTSDLNDHRVLSLTKDGHTLVSVAGSVSARVSVWPLRGSGKPVRIGRSTADGLDGVAFAPDGRLAYTSRLGGQSSIWVTRADGSDRSPLVQAGSREFVFLPVMTSDGRSFYMSSTPKGYQLRSVEKGGATSRTIVPDARRDPFSASADGRVIAFSALVDGVPHIFATDPDGTSRTTVTTVPSFSPAVDPQGRRVAYYYVKDGLFRIGVSPIGGGPMLADLATEPPGANSRLVLTDDGVYVNTVRGDRANVWLQPLDGRPARRITAFEDQILFDFAVSVDGTMLAVVRGTRLRDAQVITGFEGGRP